MQRVYRRLRRWPSTHTGRLPIPESLWAAAAELAREHGINPTAKALHLEYGKLKQRAELGQNPAAWMPWNCRETLPQAGTSKHPA